MEKIKISSLGIVTYGNGYEMLLDKFLKKMEKNIKSKKYGITYNDKGNCFFVLYDGEEYLLELDNEEMDNEIISELKMLSDIKSGIKSEESKKENEKQRRGKIIKDADEGLLPDDEAKSIYLDELKNRKPFLNELKIFFETCGVSFFKDVLIVEFGLSALCGVIGGLFGHFSANGFLAGGKIGALIGFSPVPVIIVYVILCDYIHEKKILKHKIRELEKSLNIDKSKSNKKVEKKSKHKDKTVVIKNNEVQESVKVCSYEFKDTIYKKATALLDKIDMLSNDNEKVRLKSEIRDILQEYVSGLKLEKNLGNVELSVSGCKNIIELQSRTRTGLVSRLNDKLDGVDARVDEIVSREINESELEKERLLLEERLGPIVIDSEVIDGTLREREENFVPLPVRSRGKPRKAKSRALYTKY